MPRPRLRITCLLALWLLLVALPAAATSLAEDLARTAFANGDYKQAFTLLQRLAETAPGDPERDFLLGRSAYEIGDYETAIFAFERVLIAAPQAARARLELARSQFAIGDLNGARNQFELVLEQAPPAAVSGNIERYLKQIEQAQQPLRSSGTLSLGLSYDDNVHSSPLETRIETILGNFTLRGNGAQPQEDLITQSTLLLNLLYREHPQQFGWLSTLLVHNAFYAEEQDLNLQLYGFSSGPLWQHGRWQDKLQASLHLLVLDGQRYLSSAGLSAERSWSPTESFNLSLSGQLARLDYSLDGRDALQYRFELRPVTIWRGQRLTLALGMEKTDAEDDQYSYLRRQLALRYERPLGWDFSLSLGARLQTSDYDARSPLFSAARRDDLRELLFGLSRPLWQVFQGGRIQGQLQHVITDADSNLSLYRYDKQVTSVTISYQF